MQKGWRFYLGIGLLLANLASYGVAAVVPCMGFSGAATATLIGGIILIAEIAFIASLVLLGRPFLEMLKTKIKTWFTQRQPAMPPPLRPISKQRHVTGLIMLTASFLPYFIAEFMLILDYIETNHIRFIIAMLLSSDVLFVASLFVLGSEFWERLKKLFTWPGHSS